MTLVSGACSLAALALALALALVAVGLGGLLAYAVARRTNEIGFTAGPSFSPMRAPRPERAD